MSTPPFTNVLVVNTTSNLGRPVVDELLSHGGYNVHALARPEHKNHDEQGKILDAYAERGVKIHYAELNEHVQLVGIFKGIDVILSFLSGPVLNEQIKIVDAAREAGVRRFVPSEYGITITTQDVARQCVIKAIRDAGLDYTLFTNGMFMDAEELPWGLGKAVYANGAHIAIPGDGQTKISWILTRDVAKYVVASLATPASRNAELVFVGDVRTLNEVVGFIEDLYEIKLDRRYLAAAELQRQVANPPRPELAPLLQLQLAYASGHLYIDSPTSNAQFPTIKPTTFPEYLADTLRAQLAAGGVPEALWNKGVQAVTPDWNKGVQGVQPEWNKGVQSTHPPAATALASSAGAVTPDWNKGVQGVQSEWNKGVQSTHSAAAIALASSAGAVTPDWNKGVQGVQSEWNKGVQSTHPAAATALASSAGAVAPDWNKGVQGVQPEWNKGVQAVTPDWNKGVQAVTPDWNKGVQAVTPDWNKGVQAVTPDWNKGVQAVTPDWNKGVQAVTPDWNKGVQTVTPDWNKGVQEVHPEWNKGVQAFLPHIANITATSPVARDEDAQPTGTVAGQVPH